MTNELERGLGSEGVIRQEKKEERIVCGSYNSLVQNLGLAMEPDISKIFLKKEDKFDHTDLESWVGAVDFSDGEVPDIEVNIPARGEQKAFKFNVRDMEAISGADNKVSPEVMMYSTALAEAKLYRLENKKMQTDDGGKVTLLEVMDDVYPAIRPQIKEAHKVIEAMREEILGDEAKKSLSGVLEKLESKKGYRKLMSAAMITGIVLSACGVSIEIVTPKATVTETQPGVTETVGPMTETPGGTTQPGVTETVGPIVTEVTPGVTVTETATIEPTSVPTETATAEPTAIVEIPFENGPSREFSPLFEEEIAWRKEFVGHVGDRETPIFFGLSKGVVVDTIHTPDMSIASVWMLPEAVDAAADAYLRAAHYRYTAIMGNEISYEAYLELLNQPRGGEVVFSILDEDGVTRREAMIDPRQGFSVLAMDKMSSSLGVILDPNSQKAFYGVDGQGRLLVADTSFKLYGTYYDEMYMGVPIGGHTFVFNNLQNATVFGYLKNECLKTGNYWIACGGLKAPNEYLSWWQKYIDFAKATDTSGEWVNWWGVTK